MVRKGDTMTERCVLCDKELENEYGNNPWPLADHGRCCDDCNDLVTASRMAPIVGSDPNDLAMVLRKTRLLAMEMMEQKKKE